MGYLLVNFMKNEDNFSALLAEAILNSADEDIQVEVLKELVQRTNKSTSLDDVIEESREATKEPGDFGMEIIGSLLIPILIEAGKQLWSQYVKKLSEKAASQLADYTIAQMKKLARDIFSGENNLISVNDYEIIFRKVAAQEGLKSEQIDLIVQAIRSKRILDELDNI